MDSLLIYTTIGKNEEYLKCLDWFCKSLTYTTRNTLNLLVICDIGFHLKVQKTLQQYAFLNYHLMDVPDSETPVQASMHKIKIFDFPQIFHFRTVLYVDLDCLFLGSLSFLFKKKIDDNKLYVFAEQESVEANRLINFSLSTKQNTAYICYYNTNQWNFLVKHNKLPFNAGLFMFRSSVIMEKHFRNLEKFINSYSGIFFFEQSFMNTHFHLANLSDYSIFNKSNICMISNQALEDITADHRILHFNKTCADGKGKAEAMENYFKKFKQSNPAGFAQFDTRDEMIDQLIPSGGTIVEIGVFQGDFAETLAKTNPKQLYLVDCWEAGGTCSGDVDGNNMKHFSSGEELWDSVKGRYEFYPNVSIHRQYSSEFLKTLENLSIDAIYIDGDHSYKGVKEDLNNAFPKVKKGGWIMGHDYEMNMKKAKHVYEFGVKQAVDEFCVEKGLKLFAKAMDGCVSYAIFIDPDAVGNHKLVEPSSTKSIEQKPIESIESIDSSELKAQSGKTMLCQLAEKYGVDKCPVINHSYTPAYHTLLFPLKEKINSVLEIGIGNIPLMRPMVGEKYKLGASLRMWRDYFPNAQIIGCDIDRSVLFNDEERIKTFYVDQSDKGSLLSLADTVRPITETFDIIIDDGSHIEEHMRLSFQTLWKFVKPGGGIYIIEDIKSSYMEQFANLAYEMRFIDAELIKKHKGDNTWDGFVAFRKF